MKPHPCGFAGDPRCRCAPERVRAYRARLSGPLLDRIDVHVTLPPVSISAITSGHVGESSETVRRRVVAARKIQSDRVRSGQTSALVNALLSSRDLDRVAALPREGNRMLTAAATRLGLSARAYSKVLKVARTLADLDSAEHITAAHVAEAVALRILDRGGEALLAPITTHQPSA